jgi:CubicO group peptidase (beta-lactamase class C family)
MKMTRNTVAFLCAVNLIATLVLAAVPRIANAQLPVVPPEVEANIRLRITNAYNTGIVVGLINSNGTRFFSYGRTSLDTNEAVTENTLFEIGSVTKVFTCTVLADMIERGELELTNAVQLFLPDNVRVPTRNGRVITLEHLATHTSGLPRMPTNFNPADWTNPYADYTAQNLYDFLSSYTLPRDPGTLYEYSNLGMGLLGQVLVLRSGMDYETLVTNRITDELGMGDTGITLTEDRQRRLARGYSGVVQIPNWDLLSLAGAGALRSTANDLATFLSANLGLVPSRLYPAMTNAHRVRFTSANVRVGLGWHMLSSGVGEIIWHNGLTGGYCSFVGFVRGTQRGVIVLANSDYSVDDLGIHLLDPAFPLNNVRVPATVPQTTLQSYVGRFQRSSQDYFDVGFRIGHLTVQYSGDAGQVFTLYPESTQSFFGSSVIFL